MNITNNIVCYILLYWRKYTTDIVALLAFELQYDIPQRFLYILKFSTTLTLHKSTGLYTTEYIIHVNGSSHYQRKLTNYHFHVTFLFITYIDNEIISSNNSFTVYI